MSESTPFDASGALERGFEPDASFEAILKAYLADEQAGAQAS
ncbi:hypothetical protein [Allomesorhizobium camelthorni]|nr:hypothetical protein [Mesorhizobium camelthorni]